MRDLDHAVADDLRDYFDALVEAPVTAAPTAPKHRVWLPVAAALVVVAATVALVASRHSEQSSTPAVPPPTMNEAVAEQDGLRLTVRLLGTSPYTVETTIENIGTTPLSVGGQLDPDVCQVFPVQVEAVRTAWEPGDAPWPGADHYLGPITGGGWSNVESRGSAFADPVLDAKKQALRERVGDYGCSLAGGVGSSLAPGQRASRTFTWPPPTGWPGGRHELVASYFLGYRDNLGREPIVMTARLPVDVHSDVADGMGPAEALQRLARDAAFQTETTSRGGLMGVTSTWLPGTWRISVQWVDGKSAFWLVDSGGAVTRED